MKALSHAKRAITFLALPVILTLLLSSCKKSEVTSQLETAGFIEIDSRKYDLSQGYLVEYPTIFDIRVQAVKRFYDREIQAAGDNIAAIERIRIASQQKVNNWRQIQATGVGFFSIVLLSEGLSLKLESNDIRGLTGKGNAVVLTFWSKSSQELLNGVYPISEKMLELAPTTLDAPFADFGYCSIGWDSVTEEPIESYTFLKGNVIISDLLVEVRTNGKLSKTIKVMFDKKLKPITDMEDFLGNL